MILRFSSLPPFVRQLIGAAGGAMIAVLLYTAFQEVPVFDLPIGLHGAADPEAQREERLNAVAERAREILAESDRTMP